MNGKQGQFAIRGGIVSALVLAAWFIGGRKPLEGGEYGAVAAFCGNRGAWHFLGEVTVSATSSQHSPTFF
jgi:hypothetical protein